MAPSNKEVYPRLLVLKAVVVNAVCTPRQELPELYSKWSDQERGDFEHQCREGSRALITHLKDLGAWRYASPEETRFLQSFGPNIDPQVHIDMIWRKECARVIMWALGLRESWPLIDQETDPEILKSFPEQKLGLFSPLPKLRPQSEISAKRDLIQAWHWRVRTRQLIEEDRPFLQGPEMDKLGFHCFDDVVRFSARNHHRGGDLPQIIDEDFVFLAKPFRSLTTDEYQTATSIISERHFAMNWLCGMALGNRWDETPTDT